MTINKEKETMVDVFIDILNASDIFLNHRNIYGLCFNGWRKKYFKAFQSDVKLAKGGFHKLNYVLRKSNISIETKDVEWLCHINMAEDIDKFSHRWRGKLRRNDMLIISEIIVMSKI